MMAKIYYQFQNEVKSQSRLAVWLDFNIFGTAIATTMAKQSRSKQQ
jgi:hypothetical protein